MGCGRRRRTWGLIEVREVGARRPPDEYWRLSLSLCPCRHGGHRHLDRLLAQHHHHWDLREDVPWSLRSACEPNTDADDI